ncbi:hypothetical protein [Brucella gallinifaecis]|uniref:hypothetical protein n=1 Tax=Brucella gallinifaecis TaxID=215590 RepID=UPI00235F82E7|nr:hypothetical protein [Brucella gallinifaecis]
MLFTFLPIVLTSPIYLIGLLIALALSLKITDECFKSAAFLFFGFAVATLFLGALAMRGSLIPTI